MAFKKTPSYLTEHRGNWYLKLPVPPDVRHHFPDKAGKPRTHIVQALGTSKSTEAETLKRPLLARYWADFERLQGNGGSNPISGTELDAAYARAKVLREALAGAEEANDEEAIRGTQEAAQELAEGLTPVLGDEAAMALYRAATSPGTAMLREVLKEWNSGNDVRESTKSKRELAVRELLEVLRVKDALPGYVTDDRATAYVQWLNRQELGYSTKQDRLSMLNVMWRYMARKRYVPKNSSPWVDHEVTGKGDEGTKVRGFKDIEIVKLLGAPDDAPANAHYRRPLFRELYSLGLLTGARLDSIVSLTPSALEEMKGKEKGFWLTITNDKSAAGDRTIPVVHPAAVAILKRRKAAQKDSAASIFPECRPGGVDHNLSHHVSKAMGRDRDKLGFGEEVNFHSTRHSFATIMDNSGAEVQHVQRYIGHSTGILMRTVYVDGSSKENLLKVARLVRYTAAVEKSLAEAL